MADPGPDTTLGLSELNLTDESLNDLLERKYLLLFALLLVTRVIL